MRGPSSCRAACFMAVLALGAVRAMAAGAAVSLASVTNPGDIVFMYPISRPLQITQYLIGQVGDHVAAIKTNGPGATAQQVAAGQLCAEVQRSDGTTTYRIALARKMTGEGFNLNFLMNDNDAGTLKQYLQWQPGIATLTGAKNWYRVRFVDAP
jgi:hypothetical protein